MRFSVVAFFCVAVTVCLAAQQPAVTSAAESQQFPVTSVPAEQPSSAQQDLGASTPAPPNANPEPPSQEKTSAAPASSASSSPVAIIAPESPQDLAQAKREFKAGVKLKSSGKLDEALKKFEKASQLNPHSRGVPDRTRVHPAATGDGGAGAGQQGLDEPRRDRRHGGVPARS